MSNIMQDLHAIGLNPFAVKLLAESVLKSPLVDGGEKPRQFGGEKRRSAWL